MAFRYLDEDELEVVRDAAVTMGWTSDDDLRTLATGISPAFVGTSMVGPNPVAKLLTLTEKMNATKNLVGGEVPFQKWLKNAIRYSGGAESELVFRTALQQVEPDALPAAEAREDLEEVPRIDGALEIDIGEDDTLGVAFLLEGAVAARSVAKLRVHRHFDGAPSFATGGSPDWGVGTGWLISATLMVTNHHVINARGPREPDAKPEDFEIQGKATEADFDFVAKDADATTVKAVTCVASDRELDYAVLRLADAVTPRNPLRLRPNPLTRHPATALGERVNVLQHPGGEPMRLGFRDNFVVTGTAERLSYLTDTRGGSSGSPLFDDTWLVAGLHRGWANIEGAPVQVWGKEIRQENFGTPIGRILAKLATDNPDLHAEIVAAHAALDT
jgi:endonuclease G